MVPSIARKLAILNVSVVVAIVALIGVGTWIMLGQSLNREANASLEHRIDAARETLDSLPSMSPGNQGMGPGNNAGQGAQRRTTVTPVPTEEDDSSEGEHDEDEPDEQDEESREILVSGDTLLFIFDANGTLTTNRRNVVLNRVPNSESLDAALAGETDVRFVSVDDERIRVRTEPVVYQGDVVGAIQAVRSEAEHDAELELVRTMTLIGTGAGLLVAVPAGMYLTRRAMAPITDVLHRQRAFVADASHELRAPLTVLRANAEVLTRTPDLSPDELQGELASMIGDIDDMSRLVEELLQLSRIDDPDYTVSLDDVRLQPEIERVLQMFAPQAARSKIALSSSGEDLLVHSNAGLVGQVLRIVVDNAIKYTPEGGEVRVSTRHHGDEAIIEVQDSGIGIRPEDLPYVFDRFYRADRARTRSTGSGLGLPIARGILTLLGGTIAIYSTPNEGSTARVTLPTSSDGHGTAAQA